MNTWVFFWPESWLESFHIRYLECVYLRVDLRVFTWEFTWELTLVLFSIVSIAVLLFVNAAFACAPKKFTSVHVWFFVVFFYDFFCFFLEDLKKKDMYFERIWVFFTKLGLKQCKFSASLPQTCTTGVQVWCKFDATFLKTCTTAVQFFCKLALMRWSLHQTCTGIQSLYQTCTTCNKLALGWCKFDVNLH